MNLVIKEKDKQILYLVIPIIIIIVDFLTILGWQCRLLFKYYKTVNTKKETIMTLQDDILNLDAYKNEISALDEKIKNPTVSISEEKDISVLIEDISDLANDSGVKILQIKPVLEIEDKDTTKIKNEEPSEVGIQIAAQADFHQLGNFISKVESAKSFLKVSALEIETDNKNYFIQNIKLFLKSYIKSEKELE